MKKLLNRLTLFSIVIVLLLCSFLATNKKVFADSYQHSTFDESKYWYMGKNHLNLSGIREEVNAMTPLLSKYANELEKNPIRIAVIDTGYNEARDSSYPLYNSVYRNVNGIVGYNATSNDKKDITDDAGHGTKVINVIAMLLKQVKLDKYIKIIPLKAGVRSSGESGTFSLDNVVKAIKWAGEHNIEIVNMSLGTENLGWAESENKYISKEIDKYVTRTLFVSSAGNDGKKQPFYPANSHEAILSVMSYGKDGSLHKSNYGYFSVEAPGEGIASVNERNELTEINATSAATPIVSFISSIVNLKLKLEKIDNKHADTQVAASAIKKAIISNSDDRKISLVGGEDLLLKRLNSVKAIRGAKNYISKPTMLRIELAKNTKGAEIVKNKVERRALVSSQTKENLRYAELSNVLFDAVVLPQQTPQVLSKIRWYYEINGEWVRQAEIGNIKLHPIRLDVKAIKAVLEYDGEILEDVVDTEVIAVQPDWSTVDYILEKKGSKLRNIRKTGYHIGERINLYIKGFEGVSIDDIEWLVDGKKVETVSANQITISPQKSKTILVELKYKNKVIANFKIKVYNSRIPIWSICLILIVLVSLISGGSVLIYFYIKKRKEAQVKSDELGKDEISTKDTTKESVVIKNKNELENIDNSTEDENIEEEKTENISLNEEVNNEDKETPII